MTKIGSLAEGPRFVTVIQLVTVSPIMTLVSEEIIAKARVWPPTGTINRLVLLVGTMSSSGPPIEAILVTKAPPPTVTRMRLINSECAAIEGMEKTSSVGERKL